MLQLFHLFSTNNPKYIKIDLIMVMVFIFMFTKFYVVALRLLLDLVK